MTMAIARDCIVSSTDMIKNFPSIRRSVKDGKNIIVFKNNKPDLAVLDIEEYETLLKMVETLEQYDIAKIIDERKKDDDGVRYSLQEVEAMFG